MALAARFLDALLIINIHVKISAVLFGQRDSFLINQRGVLDRSDPGANRILDSLGSVRVRFHAETKIRRFAHRSLQFLGSELGRIGVSAMRWHSASGKHFDVVHAVVRELANFLAHFPWAVRFTVVEIPWKRDIRSDTGHGAGPAGTCDVGAGDEHPRTDYVAFIDGVATRDGIESTLDADIANGSVLGLQ